METLTDVQSAINAGMTMGKVFEINEYPAVMVPEGAQLKVLPELMPRPERIKKSVQLRTIEDFIRYHNRYANKDSTVFANIDTGSFKSVIDYHEAPCFADNCDHTANYTCPETNEWASWKRHSGDWMKQNEFAEFLQDNHLQIYKPKEEEFKPEELDVVVDKLPDSTTMIEIANTLQVTSESKVTQGQNLHNGAMRISYTDEVDGRAGPNNEIEIPTYFLLGIQLFKGGNHYMILCRLKYRKEGPSVRLRYELVRPHKAHERAVLDVIKRLRGETPVKDADGKPTEETLPGIEQGHIYEIVS
ncbi:DUF2303 family protein [Marinobacterium lutimaris]|uniref:Uncharacterized conserved protein YfdQ, DUF2303 family n=1 Tax=Marinobacterium lutimaris TaxID=568106 RepID=A0A1H5XWE0_9GAMM|nr:DUF2303 family protein [Marinobacterium lutimaris]SEG15963.1 Uncharacterized conserved protein YfdQ, DUF2303 family [Marinobacterium lutimaris]